VLLTAQPSNKGTTLSIPTPTSDIIGRLSSFYTFAPIGSRALGLSRPGSDSDYVVAPRGPLATALVFLLAIGDDIDEVRIPVGPSLTVRLKSGDDLLFMAPELWAETVQSFYGAALTLGSRPTVRSLVLRLRASGHPGAKVASYHLLGIRTIYSVYGSPVHDCDGSVTLAYATARRTFVRALQGGVVTPTTSVEGVFAARAANKADQDAGVALANAIRATFITAGL